MSSNTCNPIINIANKSDNKNFIEQYGFKIVELESTIDYYILQFIRTESNIDETIDIINNNIKIINSYQQYFSDFEGLKTLILKRILQLNSAKKISYNEDFKNSLSKYIDYIKTKLEYNSGQEGYIEDNSETLDSSIMDDSTIYAYRDDFEMSYENWDKDDHEIDLKLKVSARLKHQLSTVIYETQDSNGEIIQNKNIFGTPVFIEWEIVYDYLLKIASQSLIEDRNPSYKDIIKQLLLEIENGKAPIWANQLVGFELETYIEEIKDGKTASKIKRKRLIRYSVPGILTHNLGFHLNIEKYNTSIYKDFRGGTKNIDRTVEIDISVNQTVEFGIEASMINEVTQTLGRYIHNFINVVYNLRENNDLDFYITNRDNLRNKYLSIFTNQFIANGLITIDNGRRVLKVKTIKDRFEQYKKKTEELRELGRGNENYTANIESEERQLLYFLGIDDKDKIARDLGRKNDIRFLDNFFASINTWLSDITEDTIELDYNNWIYSIKEVQDFVTAYAKKATAEIALSFISKTNKKLYSGVNTNHILRILTKYFATNIEQKDSNTKNKLSLNYLDLLNTDERYKSNALLKYLNENQDGFKDVFVALLDTFTYNEMHKDANDVATEVYDFMALLLNQYSNEDSGNLSLGMFTLNTTSNSKNRLAVRMQKLITYKDLSIDQNITIKKANISTERKLDETFILPIYGSVQSEIIKIMNLYKKVLDGTIDKSPYMEEYRANKTFIKDSMFILYHEFNSVSDVFRDIREINSTEDSEENDFYSKLRELGVEKVLNIDIKNFIESYKNNDKIDFVYIADVGKSYLTSQYDILTTQDAKKVSKSSNYHSTNLFYDINKILLTKLKEHLELDIDYYYSELLKNDIIKEGYFKSDILADKFIKFYLESTKLGVNNPSLKFDDLGIEPIDITKEKITFNIVSKDDYISEVNNFNERYKAIIELYKVYDLSDDGKKDKSYLSGNTKFLFVGSQSTHISTSKKYTKRKKDGSLNPIQITPELFKDLIDTFNKDVKGYFEYLERTKPDNFKNSKFYFLHFSLNKLNIINTADYYRALHNWLVVDTYLQNYLWLANMGQLSYDDYSSFVKLDGNNNVLWDTSLTNFFKRMKSMVSPFTPHTYDVAKDNILYTAVGKSFKDIEQSIRMVTINSEYLTDKDSLYTLLKKLKTHGIDLIPESYERVIEIDEEEIIDDSYDKLYKTLETADNKNEIIFQLNGMLSNKDNVEFNATFLKKLKELDKSVVSELYKNLNRASSYLGVDFTDAHTYITIDTWIKRAVDSGKISEDFSVLVLKYVYEHENAGDYNWSLNKKVFVEWLQKLESEDEDAFDNISIEDAITESDKLDFFLMKDVHVGFIKNEEMNNHSLYFEKMAARVLIPSDIVGSRLHNLYLGMRVTGIDRYTHDSAAKIMPAFIAPESFWTAKTDVILSKYQFEEQGDKYHIIENHRIIATVPIIFKDNQDVLLFSILHRKLSNGKRKNEIEIDSKNLGEQTPQSDTTENLHSSQSKSLILTGIVKLVFNHLIKNGEMIKTKDTKGMDIYEKLQEIWGAIYKNNNKEFIESITTNGEHDFEKLIAYFKSSVSQSKSNSTQVEESFITIKEILFNILNNMNLVDGIKVDDYGSWEKILKDEFNKPIDDNQNRQLIHDLIDDNKNLDSLAIPIFFNAISPKIQSFMLSLVEIRTYTKGFKGAVTPDTAQSRLKYQNDLVFVSKEYDGTQPLMDMRIEDGVAKPAQIILSWNFIGNKTTNYVIDENSGEVTEYYDSTLNFKYIIHTDDRLKEIRNRLKEQYGNDITFYEDKGVFYFKKIEKDVPLDIEDYIIRNDRGQAFLNTDKLPRTILQGFLNRIPTQGLPSGSAVEIVAFLRPHTRGTAVAPNTFITRMGQDFDIDTLYGILKNYRMVDNKFIYTEFLPKDDSRLIKKYLRNKGIPYKLKTIDVKSILKAIKYNIEEKEKLTKLLNDLINRYELTEQLKNYEAETNGTRDWIEDKFKRQIHVIISYLTQKRAEINNALNNLNTELQSVVDKEDNVIVKEYADLLRKKYIGEDVKDLIKELNSRRAEYNEKKNKEFEEKKRNKEDITELVKKHKTEIKLINEKIDQWNQIIKEFENQRFHLQIESTIYESNYKELLNNLNPDKFTDYDGDIELNERLLVELEKFQQLDIYEQNGDEATKNLLLDYYSTIVLHPANIYAAMTPMDFGRMKGDDKTISFNKAVSIISIDNKPVDTFDTTDLEIQNLIEKYAYRRNGFYEIDWKKVYDEYGIKNFVTALVDTNKRSNPNSIATNVEAYSKGRDTAVGIGWAALHQVTINNMKLKEYPFITSKLEFVYLKLRSRDGQELETHQLNDKMSDDGITDTLETSGDSNRLVSIMVDNEKEGIASGLGFYTFMLNAIAGFNYFNFPLTWYSNFFKQPIIMDLYKIYNRLIRERKKRSEAFELALMEVMGVSNIVFNDIYSHYKSSPVPTHADLLNNLTIKNYDKSNAVNKYIIESFYIAHTAGEQLTSFQTAFNIDAARVPNPFYAVYRHYKKIEQVISPGFISGLNNMYGRSMKVKKQFDSQLEKEGYAFYSIYDFITNTNNITSPAILITTFAGDKIKIASDLYNQINSSPDIQTDRERIERKLNLLNLNTLHTDGLVLMDSIIANYVNETDEVLRAKKQDLFHKTIEYVEKTFIRFDSIYTAEDIELIPELHYLNDTDNYMHFDNIIFIPTTHKGNAVVYGVWQALKQYSPLFPYTSQYYVKTVIQAGEILNVNMESMTNVDKINKDLRSFLTQNVKLYNNEDFDAYRYRQYIQKLVYEMYPKMNLLGKSRAEYEFLTKFKLEKLDAYIDLLEFNNTNVSPEEEDKFRKFYKLMLQDSEITTLIDDGNEIEIRPNEIASFIFNYHQAIYGGVHSFRNFASKIPNEVLGLSEVGKSLRGLDLQNYEPESKMEELRYMMQLIQHVPNIVSSSSRISNAKIRSVSVANFYFKLKLYTEKKYQFAFKLNLEKERELNIDFQEPLIYVAATMQDTDNIYINYNMLLSLISNEAGAILRNRLMNLGVYTKNNKSIEIDGKVIKEFTTFMELNQTEGLYIMIDNLGSNLLNEYFSNNVFPFGISNIHKNLSPLNGLFVSVVESLTNDITMEMKPIFPVVKYKPSIKDFYINDISEKSLRFNRELSKFKLLNGSDIATEYSKLKQDKQKNYTEKDIANNLNKLIVETLFTQNFPIDLVHNRISEILNRWKVERDDLILREIFINALLNYKLIYDMGNNPTKLDYTDRHDISNLLSGQDELAIKILFETNKDKSDYSFLHQGNQLEFFKKNNVGITAVDVMKMRLDWYKSKISKSTFLINDNSEMQDEVMTFDQLLETNLFKCVPLSN